MPIRHIKIVVILLVLTIIGVVATRAFAAFSPPTGVSNGSHGMVWLQVTWVEHPPVDRISILDVNTAGWVRYFPEIKQYGTSLGGYVFQLPADRHTDLQQAVLQVSQKWKDTKFKRPNPRTSRWVEVEIGDKGWKRMLASAESMDYPASLQGIFEFTPEGLRGLIPTLVTEATQQPSAIINAHTEVSKQTYRVGKKIPVTLVIENVGTLAIEIPLRITEHYGGAGYAAFILPPPWRKPEEGFFWQDPREQKDKVVFKLNPQLKFSGGKIVGAGKERALRLEPGQTLRVPVPTPLIAKEKGSFVIAGELWLHPFYTYETSRPTILYAPMDEVLRHTPVTITVK